MASITPLGGPNRAQRDPYQVLRAAVVEDLKHSTEQTRGAVIAARLAYLEDERQRNQQVAFDIAVGNRMRLLTAEPVAPVESKGHQLVGWVLFVAVAAAVLFAAAVWAVR